jgi:hypothetical protein
MGGLCNRLAAILSYRAAYGSIIVEWGDTAQVGGTLNDWHETFEPISGVTFVEGPPLPVVHHGGPVVLPNGIIADNFASKAAPPTWVEGYRDLKLQRHLWENNKADMSKAVFPTAIHVRRTDHVKMAKGMGAFTSDEEFLGWLADKPDPIYIATDNGTTQRDFAGFIDALKKRAAVYAWIEEHKDQDLHDHRNTGLAHAAIDLFTCARADHFMGTRGSSYSVTIQLLHQVGGWWSQFGFTRPPDPRGHFCPSGDP